LFLSSFLLHRGAKSAKIGFVFKSSGEKTIMPYKNRMDFHVHTDNSFDGHHSAILLCETAVEKGLRAVAFTDHVEMDFFRENHFDRTARQSFFEVVKARGAFTGKLIVCAGLELGQPLYNLPESEHLVQLYSYDVIIASIHNLRGKEDFYYLRRAGVQPDDEIHAMLREYFDELLALAQWGKFDVLAHLTYPLRYIYNSQGLGKIDMQPYAAQIDAVLEAAAKNNLALEINTAGLRQDYGRLVPDEAILRRFKELGGQRVTIGSDAHYADHLGLNIDRGMDLARRCGFEHVTLFKQRDAIAVEIM